MNYESILEIGTVRLMYMIGLSGGARHSELAMIRIS